MFSHSEADYFKIPQKFGDAHPANPDIINCAQDFNPYSDNHGSVLALKGRDYIIIAADKRLSSDSSIISRNTSKICQLTDKIYLCSAGMYADFVALSKYMKARIEMYRNQTRKEPSLKNAAQLLQVALYQKRFFPYYCFTAICGLEDNGKVGLYGYDAIGSYESTEYGALGSGTHLITPVIDNVMRRKGYITEEEGKKLALETMNGTSCRDIYTGDRVEIVVIREDGRVSREEFKLRSD